MRKILYRVSYKKETVTVKQYLRDMKNITAKSVTISVIHMPDSRPFDNKKKKYMKVGKKKVACLPANRSKTALPFSICPCVFRFFIIDYCKENIACAMSIWGIIFEN